MLERFEVKFASDDIDAKTGQFAGYGAVFGNLDAYGDVIVPGAFKTTLREWKTKKTLPPMLLQHGGWMMVDTDSIPIGKWTAMEEDETGLRVEGKLINLDTDLGRRVYGAMKEGVLDGMSIGYRAKKFTMGTKPDEPRRKLEVVDLIELSIVTFPANGKARVSDIKGLESIKTIRDFEGFLRDVGGFSNAAARAIAAGGFKASDPRDEDEAEIAAQLRRNVELLSKR